MNFRRPKQEVINNAHSAAMSCGQMYVPDFQYMTIDQAKRELQNSINLAIANAVRAGIQSLVNDVYTDEEFENDIGLNKP
jgi:hypothetical protein